MSYTMEFENRANARPDDSIIEYNGFVIGMSPFFLSNNYLKMQSTVMTRHITMPFHVKVSYSAFSVL